MKFKTVFIFMFIVLVTSGCGKLSDIERITQASEKMSGLNNYSFNIKMDVIFKVLDEELKMDIKSYGINDEKNQRSHQNMDINVMGKVVSVETYTNLGSYSPVSYYRMGDTSEWYKGKAEDESKTEVLGFSDVLLDNVSFTLVESNDDNYHYKIVIKNEAFLDIMKNIEGFVSDDEEQGFKIDGDFEMDVYINEDNYITKIFLDLSGLITFDEDIEGSIEKFTMEIDISDFNTKGDIVIPEDIIKNAIDDETL